MESQIDPSTVKPKEQEKPESAGQHVKAFVWMMIFTAAAFILVGTGVASAHANVVIPILLLLATIQVAMQLYTFMHLDQKGSFFPILFVICGIIGAIVCILAMTLWV